jgi:hypothetical protein
MNTSRLPFVSFGTRFVAFDQNTTIRPSPEMDDPPLWLLPCCPEVASDMRSVVG